MPGAQFTKVWKAADELDSLIEHTITGMQAAADEIGLKGEI